jgi:phenylacetate-CoA ligase
LADKNHYFNRKLETLDQKEIQDLQLRRFRQTVNLAFGSTMYRRAFKQLKRGPDDIRTIEDLRKMHFFTTKDDLRAAYPLGASAVQRQEIVEMHATSGTTGTPVVGLHTSKDLEDWGDIAARCLAMSGLAKDDVFQITPSLGMFSGGFGFYHGARKVGCTIVPASAGLSQRQIRFMVDFKTTMFAAIVSYALRLAEVALEEGIDLKTQTAVRKGIFGSEIWTRETKSRIANLWDLEPYDIYGFTELYGPGVGGDCRLHDGLHIWQDHFLVEVIDPNTGDPVGPEEKGELVFTTLTKEAMPLLRFRSRDISFLIDSLSCDCGRTHRRYKEIIGRSDDMVKVSGVNFWPSSLESILLREDSLSHEYKITISRTKEGLDRVMVEVESKDPIEEIKNAQLSERLAREIRNTTLFSPEIRVVSPGSLPRSELGKKQKIFDERSP